MGKDIINRQYWKLAGASVCIIVLAVVSGMTLHLWVQSLIMMSIILLYACYIGGIIYWNDKQGNYVSIYGMCDDVEIHHSKIPFVQEKRYRTYRICTMDEQGDISYFFLSVEQDATPLALRAFGIGHGLRSGEAYCFVFKKVPDGSFTEKNLLGYKSVPQEVALYDNSTNTAVEPKQAAGNTVDINTEKKTPQGEKETVHLIMFPGGENL